METLGPASTISHYQIKEPIGSGGMGEVYKAVDLQLGRVVALKTLPPARAADQDANRRFLREARAASILSHPSICTIYEVGQDGDLAYIAMQYVQGRTIEHILAKGPLPIEDALSYALDVADALDEAHKNGVIHRDIKPANIIVNERGLAIVLDFGLAKQLASAETRAEESPTLLQVTAAAVIVGTIPYMSPEQVRQEAVDARSDIFSFGSMLYEMLAGKRPFDGPGKVETLHAILHQEPAPVSQVRPEVDGELDRIIGKALKKNAEDRYQSAAELKMDLMRLVQERGYAVRGISRASVASGAGAATVQTRGAPAADLSSITGRVLSRIPYWRYLLVLTAAVLIGGIWWLLAGSRHESELYLPSSLRHVQLAEWKSEASEGSTAGSFSPDGKMFAFASTRGGNRNIWIRHVGGGEPVQITKDERSALNPIWSPDGREIAFVSWQEGQVGIWHTSSLGGVSSSLKIFDRGSMLPRLKRWSSRGGKVYYESNQNLFALDVASGQTAQVTNFDPSGSSAADFNISPNEDWIAYVYAKDGQFDIWAVAAKGGAPIRVSNDAAEDREPVWHPDGNRIIYSSNRDGTFQICAAFLDGRKPLQLTFGERDCFVSDVSADGTKILYGASKEESDIWGVNTATGEESEITSEVGCEFWPDVSPDSKKIAFQTIREPSQGAKINKSAILTRPVRAGGEQIQLAVDGMHASWSPDGGRVAFLRTSGDIQNIWTVRASGGDEKQLTTRDVLNSGNSVIPYTRRVGRDYSWSPDGGRIVYCSGVGDSNVWIISADGSTETNISNTSNPALYFFCPLWSRDGSRVAYMSETKYAPGGAKPTRCVCLAELATRKTEVIFESDSVLRLLGWSQSGNELFVAVKLRAAKGPTGDEVSLIQISIGGGNKRVIAGLPNAYFNSIELSPDSRTIAISSHQDGKDNILVIRTLDGEVRKLTANTDPRIYFSSMAFSPDGKMIYFGKQSRSSLFSMIENFR